MVKETKLDDVEINLIEIIRIFWSHKYKYLIMGVVGIIISLVYLNENKITFTTTFKPSLSHPFVSIDLLYETQEIKQLINNSELNQSKLPYYKFIPKTRIFRVTSEYKINQDEVKSLLSDALRNELQKYKTLAIEKKTPDEVISANSKYKAFVNGMIFQRQVGNRKPMNFVTTNQDIAKMNIDDVINSLEVSFGAPIEVKPPKKWIFGFFAGLILAFFWMLGSIIKKMF